MASSTACSHQLQRACSRPLANARLPTALPAALSRLPARRRGGGRPGAAVVPVAAAAGVRLAGVGSSVPEKFLTNSDLAQLVDTSDDWITSRTGIKKRHILSEGESLGSHASAACLRALDMAGVAAEDVDLIVMATSSPDDLFGSATTVQACGRGQAVHAGASGSRAGAAGAPLPCLAGPECAPEWLSSL